LHFEFELAEYLNEPQRALRRKLRSSARAICGSSYQNNSSDSAENALNLQPLIWEVAYEHWHRMLFARFLVENGLLMWEAGDPFIDHFGFILRGEDTELNEATFSTSITRLRHICALLRRR